MIAGWLASLAPLALLAFNRDWMFTPAGYLDPWQYVGFFHEYLNPNYSPGAYKIARLPWILAGYLTHAVFPPVLAAYVLHAVFLSVTSLALFAGLYALLRRVALAAVVATALGFYTHAHGSGGWDYHNTGAGAFYLLTFVLLALPGTIAGSRMLLTLTGAMTALAVHSNITLVNFLPALAFVHLSTIRLRAGSLPGAREIAARIAWVLLGLVLLTGLLGLINWAVRREFLFFAALANMVSQYVADPQRQSRFHRAWSWDWVLTARHLALPTAVFVAGMASLVLHRRATLTTTDRLARSLIVQFLFMSLVWVAWQTAGQTALDWHHMAYPLIPACFIALGGLLALGWPDVFERYWLATTLGTAVVCWLCLVGRFGPFIPNLTASVGGSVTLAACTMFAAALLAFSVRPAVATGIVVIGVFAFGNRFAATDRTNYRAGDPCQTQPAAYSAVVEGASWLGTLDPTYTRVRTWFDEEEVTTAGANCVVRVGLIGYSITTMASVPYLTPPWPMPGVEAVPEPAVQALGGDTILAIVTDKPQHIDAWSRRLARAQVTHREIARHRVPLLSSGFSIYAWQVEQQIPATASFGAPVLAMTDKTPPPIYVYGTPKGGVVSENDLVIFRPTDVRDHLAYPFVTFSEPVNDTWARVTLELPTRATNAPSCRVVVQSSELATLATAPCESAKRYVKLPSGTAGIRVYLSDASLHAIVVPRRIEIALSDASIHAR